MDGMNWRLVDESELYWLEDLVPKPTREVLQSEPSEAVKNYLKTEEEKCMKKLATRRNTNTTGLPPCPCISPDLRKSRIFYPIS